jgi:hypothetical protein
MRLTGIIHWCDVHIFDQEYALTLTLSQRERELLHPLPLGEGRGEGAVKVKATICDYSQYSKLGKAD